MAKATLVKGNVFFYVIQKKVASRAAVSPMRRLLRIKLFVLSPAQGNAIAKEKGAITCALLGTGHPAAAVTVASFQTWRGWRRSRRPVP